MVALRLFVSPPRQITRIQEIRPMTWLSRLLPQGTRLPLVSTPKGRTPLSKRHRRMATLERLEERRLLTGGSVSTSAFNFSASGNLNLLTDGGNNTFEIYEFKSGGATFVTLNATGTTRIDGNLTTWTSNHPVANITVTATNTTVDHDQILMDSDGQAETTKNVTFSYNKGWLQLDVEGVRNAGSFALSTHGQLDLTINNSSFTGISVNQDLCCPAHVTLTNDTSNGGPVTVKEGWGDKSSIYLSNDSFGITNLAQEQGAHPVATNCNGIGDTITVLGSKVSDLTVTQGSGAANCVTIDGLGVMKNGNKANSFFGVVVSQGDGKGDCAYVSGIYIANPNANVGSCAGISITQGNGQGDIAQITNSTVPGNVTIQQGDGHYDSALVDNVLAGSPNDLTCGYIHITQGNGYDDSATVDDSATWMLEITVKQGDGECDEATVSFSEAGLAHLYGIDTIHTAPGYIKITQGKANINPGGKTPPPDCGDTAEVLYSYAATYITISQSDVADTSGNGNYAEVKYSTAADGSITVTQGERDHDTAVVDHSSATGSKTVAGSISVTQGNGTGDTATVSYSYANTGDITVMQGNGDGDTATVTDSTASGNISVTQGNGNDDEGSVEYSYAGGNISVTQGNGNNDEGEVEASTASGDITIMQGDGNYDEADAYGVVAGSVDYSYGYPKDVHGTLTIIQGNGYCDTVNVASLNDTDTTINNLFIAQGNSTPFTGCVPGCNDTVNVSDSDILSDMTILQGIAGNVVGGAETGAGNYVVNVAADFNGGGTIFPGGEGGTGPVVVGGATTIQQAGADNAVYLGGNYGGDDALESEYTGFDFITNTLDVWTGLGGEAYANATNVYVVAGPAFQGATIDGGGVDNVADLLNNYNVTVGNFN
jgi:hypothetical protein